MIILKWLLDPSKIELPLSNLFRIHGSLSNFTNVWCSKIVHNLCCIKDCKKSSESREWTCKKLSKFEILTCTGTVQNRLQKTSICTWERKILQKHFSLGDSLRMIFIREQKFSKFSEILFKILWIQPMICISIRTKYISNISQSIDCPNSEFIWPKLRRFCDQFMKFRNGWF